MAMSSARDAIVAGGEAVRGLTGARRLGFAFVCGLFSAAAFAPYGVFPLLLLGYAGLLLLIDGAVLRARPRRSSFWAGWAFGFGQFLAGLYWIAYPFLVDPLAHAWQIPFAVTLLPAGLALFPAAAAAASAHVWRRGARRALVFAAFFALAVYLRGHILTGFPWNLPAYGWAASLAVLQSASVVGAYGLSLLTILFGASLALFADRERQAVALPLAMAALFAVLWGLGWARMAALQDRFVPHVQLRLVQPDVPQNEKFAARFRRRNWQSLFTLSTEPAAVPPTHIVWPEAAPPFLFPSRPFAPEAIRRLTADGTVLITGVVLGQPLADDRLRYTNSVLIYGRDGTRVARYDKFHLVPFGEYLPLAGLLHVLGIDKLVEQPGGFASGDGPHTYAVPGAPPAGVLICYEVIFPGAVMAARRPSWLVNVTDDSWFGPPGSSGPLQHLLTAQVRAIEEGVPIARAANTGVSAIIDPEGRILARLDVDKEGVVDGRLPAALGPTIYARIGDNVFLFLLFLCAIIANIGRGPVLVQIASRYFSAPEKCA